MIGGSDAKEAEGGNVERKRKEEGERREGRRRKTERAERREREREKKREKKRELSSLLAFLSVCAIECTLQIIDSKARAEREREGGEMRESERDERGGPCSTRDHFTKQKMEEMR